MTPSLAATFTTTAGNSWPGPYDSELVQPDGHLEAGGQHHPALQAAIVPADLQVQPAGRYRVHCSHVHQLRAR